MTTLHLDEDGPGSYEDIQKYVRTVLEQRTDIKPGDWRSHESLATAITKSILHRLGILSTGSDHV